MAVLIIIFSLLAWRYAVLGKLDIHRQWTLRLFLAVSGVWFFRVGLMFWVATTGGAGIEFESFTGPFLDIWSFAQYLLPLGILEPYFLAQRAKSEIAHYGHGNWSICGDSCYGLWKQQSRPYGHVVAENTIE